MREIERLKALCRELRTALGPGVPDREILEHAAAIIDFFQQPEKADRVYVEPRSQPYLAWAVDVAMAADNGWRVLNSETGMCRDLWRDDSDNPLPQDRQFRIGVASK